MEFSFVIRDHDYNDVMKDISMLGRIERETLFIVKDQDIDANRRFFQIWERLYVWEETVGR